MALQWRCQLQLVWTAVPIHLGKHSCALANVVELGPA